MINTTDRAKTIHHGRNVKRFREMLGIKQDSLAFDLGDDWNQKKISLLEQREVIESTLLEQIADVLKIPAEAIRNFDEEQAVNIIANTFNDNAVLNGINYNLTFNPLDKLMDTMEENKRLYEALLSSEREKIALLEKMLAEKKEN